jgi:hypothetical protein
MKTRKQCITMAIIAIIVFAIIGCKQDDPSPTVMPVPQSKTFTIIATNTENSITRTANVTVNYTALPNTLPSYMSTLETALKGVFSTNYDLGKDFNLTINVISSLGIEGFTNAGSKTLSVDASWIANATEQQMGISMTTKFAEWAEMH